MEPADVVLRFLESVGRADEAEFYLALFRAEAKERFAALHIDASVLRLAADAVILELSFLASLGLTPVVTLGLFAPALAPEQARALERRLVVAGVPAARVPAEEATETARQGVVPILVLSGGIDELVERVGQLSSRKLIFLNRAGGFRIKGALVPIVNLTTEAEALASGADLSRKQQALVAYARRVVFGVPHKMTVAVTAPLDLLRELFTVRGAGTLLRRGAVITRQPFAQIDPVRMTTLLASSFGRPVSTQFFDLGDADVHLEEGYRGAAVLVPTPLGAYLSKFAVEREGQGEGIGRDLWQSVSAVHPTVFWRARASNPIGTWYTKIADGLTRFSDWHIFWRGLDAERIPAAIAYARAQPLDFP